MFSGDVDGSVEAILDSLVSYRSDQCKLNILHHGVGPPSNNDIEMANSFNGTQLYNTMCDPFETFFPFRFSVLVFYFNNNREN